jgi:Protein of unknown function (DUF4231)
MGDSDPARIGGTSITDITLERLEDQIAWYDRKAGFNQKAFKRLKICTMASAALIPLFATGTEEGPQIAALLGVLIVILEGLQQTYQFHTNWISYRSTCEALKHEKFLYFAKAGAYAKDGDPHALLAEHIESLVSQEHAKWTSSQEQSQKRGAASGKEAFEPPVRGSVL